MVMILEPGDFQGEPKKVFVNLLIKNVFMIEVKLFYESRYLAAIEPLQGLINSLRRDSMDALDKQYKELVSFEANTNLCSPEKLKRIYRDVMAYLHENYLKDSYYARPRRPSKGFPGVPER